MNVQKMVNRVYKKKKLDRFKPITRYEYEQRDLRTKLDLANIYMLLQSIQDALGEQGIALVEEKDKEDLIVNIVKEDRQSWIMDLAEEKYKERVEAYKNGDITEGIKRLFIGEPVTPLFEDQEANKAKESPEDDTKKSVEPSEEDKIKEFLSGIEEKGGVQKATPAEKETLMTILEEVKSVISTST